MAEQGSSKRPAAKRTAAKRTARATRSHDAGSGEGEFRSGPAPRTAFIAGNTFAAKAVRYVEVDGMAMFEGDIVLGPVDAVEQTSSVIAAQIRGEVAAGVAITGNQYRWTNCVVPYDIDAGLPSQARVTDAIAHWESHTGFSFVLRTPANAASYPDWVTFRSSSGCSSSVGRQGGQQFVNLGSGCTTGNAIHEIGHTVGLWHEQSREDRDAFVTIHWDKIQPGYEHNFDQHITDGDDIGAYDYGSIMHYPRNAFTVDGSDTITPLVATATIGQRTALSAGDIAAAGTLCTPATGVETIKETSPETIKETIPETVKELSPETVKERIPETIKERIPETIKERIPETIKERIPETRKEFIETVVETAVEHLPGLPGLGQPPGPLTPGVAAGQLPFAMRTPQTGAADADPQEQLLAQLAAVNQAVDETNDQLQALIEQQRQVTATLNGLGWQ
jgi:hypothetical protein